MGLFARCFLLVFAQLYVGGVLALSVPPFYEVARGFYKSTASVYIGAGVLMLAGRASLLLRGESAPGGAEIVELTLWVVSLAAGFVYLHSLWTEAMKRRARAYVVTWMSGLLALLVGAQSFRLSPVLSLETVLYPVSFVASAVVLGAVCTGMLLGHWYLIEHELSIEPFRRLFRFFVRSLTVQACVLAITGVALALFGSGATAAALAKLMTEHLPLLAVRLGLSPVAAGGVAWMIARTLEIPQTMAATGLFYIAILAVLVGEMMGRFVLFRTALPF